VPEPHRSPSAHLVLHDPPQSVSVSLPFFTKSVHVAPWHTPVVQTPLAQSPAPAQPWPVVHLGQLEPQSLSVSVPFLTASVQVGA
jgi:hypothetical protein